MSKVRNYRITATVKEVTGLCQAGMRPGSKVSFVVPRVDLEHTDKICINAMSALMPFIRQFSFEKLSHNARAFISCPDPGPTKGGHGNVLFEITRKFIGFRKKI